MSIDEWRKTEYVHRESLFHASQILTGRRGRQLALIRIMLLRLVSEKTALQQLSDPDAD